MSDDSNEPEFLFIMSAAIFKALWTLLFFVSSACDTFLWLIFYFRFTYSKILDTISDPSGRSDIYFLEKCRIDFKKIPKHLSVIIGADEITPDVLSKIAVYALISGIEYVSYFDVKNEFTLDQVDIPKFINSQKMQNGRFLWSMPVDRKSGLLRYKNGLERSIEVVVLSEKEGKVLLAEVCKELFTHKNSPEIKQALGNKDCLAKKINAMLQKRLDNLPDPELAVLFDKTMCTYGLLPWHTGFTQFDRIQTGCYFNVKMFANILYKFSRCEQRFGK